MPLSFLIAAAGSDPFLLAPISPPTHGGGGGGGGGKGCPGTQGTAGGAVRRVVVAVAVRANRTGRDELRAYLTARAVAAAVAGGGVWDALMLGQALAWARAAAPAVERALEEWGCVHTPVVGLSSDGVLHVCFIHLT